MGMGRDSFSRGLVACAAVAATAAILPAGAGAASTVSCRASALRIGSIEPSVANAAGTPCRTASGVQQTRWSQFDTGGILRSQTTVSPTGGTGLRRRRPAPIPASRARRTSPAGSDAYVSCQGGKPVVVGAASDRGRRRQLGAAAGERQQTPLNVGNVVFLNESVSDAHSGTFRALRVATPAGDIVAGESQASFTGNPC